MDPTDQTFMTIHNLAPDANILFASESIFDILGYTPDEVKGKSCFDYFHPDEVPFARSIHSRGVLLDKAAVLHYARILSKDGRWVNCECCFTIVHDVFVASTSIYQQGGRSSRRALEAPQIRRIFSSSPRDPRYHMLEHLSPKFKMPPMEREPRAALILNRFTRNLSIMFATTAVTSILGLQPDEIKDKAFYECIQENCLQDAIQCLESAKANESIAYLRFWYRDPRTGTADQEDEDDEDEEGHSCCSSQESDGASSHTETKMELDDEPYIPIKVEDEDGDDPMSTAPPTAHQTHLIAQAHSNSRCRSGRRTRRPPAPSFELEAVVSCTSDGLVVVLRKARPPIPLPHPPLPPPFNFENGLFAAPWGQRPIEPYFPPELLYRFRAPLLPQYMPLRESVKAAGGPPLDQLMRSIRDVAVFAWALTGINGNLASYGRGIPGGEPQSSDGLSAWDAASGDMEGPDAAQWGPADDKGKGPATVGLPYGTLRTGYNSYTSLEQTTLGYSDYQNRPHQSLAGSYPYGNVSLSPSQWAQPSTSYGPHCTCRSPSSSGYPVDTSGHQIEHLSRPPHPQHQLLPLHTQLPTPRHSGNLQEPRIRQPQPLGSSRSVSASPASSPSGSSDRLRHGWP